MAADGLLLSSRVINPLILQWLYKGKITVSLVSGITSIGDEAIVYSG